MGEELSKKIQEFDARDNENELDEQGREERFLLAEQNKIFFKVRSYNATKSAS